MKLLRFQQGEEAALGVVKDDNIVVPLCGFSTMLDLIGGGDASLAEARAQRNAATSGFEFAHVRLLPPLERPGKYLAIGMNYGKHAEEAARLGLARAEHQTWFNKQTSCIAGPHDPIAPGPTEKLDYEVELGAVIGNRARNVSAGDAEQHVFGYLVANDVSARDWQFHSPTITMGKSFDTHGPIGPWIVTRDEVPNPHTLALRSYVNGELRQDSNTQHMIANIWEQISYLSTAFTLDPGDLLATGTPEGVGVGMNPPRFLKSGDIVRCEIDGIGAIENTVAASN